MGGGQIAGLVFGGMGALCLLGAIAAFRSMKRFLANANQATASVTRLEERTLRLEGGGTRIVQVPYLRFQTADGQEVEFVSEFYAEFFNPGKVAGKDLEVGHPVQILYDPNNPQSAKVNRSTMILPKGLIIIGIPLIALGATLWFLT